MKITNTEIDGIKAKEAFNKGVEENRTKSKVKEILNMQFSKDFRRLQWEFLEVEEIEI